MFDTVEELEEALEATFSKMENIAARVYEKEIDAYQGFMESEKYKDEIVTIGNKLKEKGIDITKRISDTLE
ncbi:MAG: hypothetical protein A2513_00225 [Sulfurimonas sp. RIFOXYD12_FULL_33_39]|nr:MAG: hypothetical protein A3G74_00330 [Sulfurimonas sp. RIFCSPLOWO2_12_FULL_34_6]OHE10993.1 MAG: hypothetical protein A2513_00225 [Sulfurimonas sp. RIFOXYD12_FULL_33_39]OHE13531.1 MAG: hypothetical protein A2530_07955 [Sulfurimonas sp. RIFOXYD2_FULL_34_21]